MLIWLKNQGKVRYRTFQLRQRRATASTAACALAPSHRPQACPGPPPAPASARDVTAIIYELAQNGEWTKLNSECTRRQTLSSCERFAIVNFFVHTSETLPFKLAPSRFIFNKPVHRLKKATSSSRAPACEEFDLESHVTHVAVARGWQTLQDEPYLVYNSSSHLSRKFPCRSPHIDSWQEMRRSASIPKL